MSETKELKYTRTIDVLNIISIIGCFPIVVTILLATFVFQYLPSEIRGVGTQISIVIIRFVPIFNVIWSIMTTIIANLMKVTKKYKKRTLLITIITIRINDLSSYTILLFCNYYKRANLI